MEEQTVKNGRLRRYTPEQIADYTKQWRESGQSKKAFCLSNKINYYTLIGWVNALKRKKAASVLSNSFIPVKVRENNSASFAEVYYSNGSRIVLRETVGAKYLRDLIK
ncbi:MAG: IS66 family insertion sequence element accessory protein TnpA [Bacteroidia bacterium]